jgi:hypothetical protein
MLTPIRTVAKLTPRPRYANADYEFALGRRKPADIPYPIGRGAYEVVQELVEERYAQDVLCQRFDKKLGGR